MRLITDPSELLTLFGQQPAVHVYGLGDLDEPLWRRSRWYRHEDAVVGIINLSEDPELVAVYAITVANQAATIRLLLALLDEIPDGAFATGPPGTTQWVAQVRSIEDHGVHAKLQIKDCAQLQPAPDVVELDENDIGDLVALYETDPGTAFFTPSMLEGGVWVGVRSAGKLVAAGGTHVRGVTANVAALGGIFTDPAARGQGYGGQITSYLAHQLLSSGAVVGLNVEVNNHVAKQMYRNLGFEEVHHYDEFAFLPTN